MSISIKPLGNRVVVEPIEQEDVTASGIVLPDTAKEKPQKGLVVAVGNGKLQEDGSIRKLDVKEGDKVLFSKYSGNEIKMDGVEHLIMREDDVLAILE